jgi:hypothetical protein
VFEQGFQVSGFRCPSGMKATFEPSKEKPCLFFGPIFLLKGLEASNGVTLLHCVVTKDEVGYELYGIRFTCTSELPTK